MKAMLLTRLGTLEPGRAPLSLQDVSVPEPGPREVLVRVSACGICHTELDEIEGRTPPPQLPVILGHQIVGNVERAGREVSALRQGQRVGVAWIYSACGHCRFCLSGRENLCPEFKATGRDANGGYAEYVTVPEAFAYPVPATFTDAQVAPLLCAGAIGYRSLSLTGLQDGQTLGLVGFGASAHLVLQLARHVYPRSPVYVFARRAEEQAFARELGAAWAGGIADEPPARLSAAIDTTPVWTPMVEALKNLDAGGRLVVNAIRKEEGDRAALLRLDYTTHLWQEKEIKSVANVTRRDVSEFLALAAEIGITPTIEEYGLEDANQALAEVKAGKIQGAKVLRVH